MQKLFYILVCFIPLIANSAQTKNTKNAAPPSKTAKTRSHSFSITRDHKKTPYTAREFEGLTLSANCFKKGRPDCEAYKASLKKVSEAEDNKPQLPGFTNVGAAHCTKIGGTGLIGETAQGNQSDYCLFNDGSIVSSWSAYYKTHPQK